MQSIESITELLNKINSEIDRQTDHLETVAAEIRALRVARYNCREEIADAETEHIQRSNVINDLKKQKSTLQRLLDEKTGQAALPL
jgi:predicted  nucleic acid-binding Zn-ribbon protein